MIEKTFVFSEASKDRMSFSLNGGITNRKYECYAISVLQLMAHFKKIASDIQSNIQIIPILSDLSILFGDILHSSHAAIIPESLLSFFSINPNVQGNSLDFIEVFFDRINNIGLNLSQYFLLKIIRPNAVAINNFFLLADINHGVDNYFTDRYQNCRIVVQSEIVLITCQKCAINESQVRNILMLDDCSYFLCAIFFFRELNETTGHIFVSLHDSNGWYQCNDQKIFYLGNPLDNLENNDEIILLCYINDLSSMAERNGNSDIDYRTSFPSPHLSGINNLFIFRNTVCNSSMTSFLNLFLRLEPFVNGLLVIKTEDEILLSLISYLKNLVYQNQTIEDFKVVVYDFLETFLYFLGNYIELFVNFQLETSNDLSYYISMNSSNYLINMENTIIAQIGEIISMSDLLIIYFDYTVSIDTIKKTRLPNHLKFNEYDLSLAGIVFCDGIDKINVNYFVCFIDDDKYIKIDSKKCASIQKKTFDKYFDNFYVVMAIYQKTGSVFLSTKRLYSLFTQNMIDIPVPKCIINHVLKDKCHNVDSTLPSSPMFWQKISETRVLQSDSVIMNVEAAQIVDTRESNKHNYDIYFPIRRCEVIFFAAKKCNNEIAEYFPDTKGKKKGLNFKYYGDYTHICDNCGSILLNHDKTCIVCSKLNSLTYDFHSILPVGPPDSLADRIVSVNKTIPLFAKKLNAQLSPVVRSLNIGRFKKSLQFLDMQGTPYCYMPFKEEKKLAIEMVFTNSILYQNDDNTLESDLVISETTRLILFENAILRRYLNVKAMTEIQHVMEIKTLNTSDDLSLIRVGSGLTLSVVFDEKNVPSQIRPYTKLFDQVCFPLLFWNGNGGIGNSDQTDGSNTMNRNWKLIAFSSQESFVNSVSLLREEFNLVTFGRIRDCELEMIYRSLNILRNECDVRNPNNDQQYGERIFISSNIIGSKSYWNKQTLNLLTIVQVHGNPTWFLTLSCNPHWPEIVILLKDDESYSENGKVVSEVFHDRFETLLDVLKKRSSILGKIMHYFYRIEFQQRGLPHVHLLLWTQCSINTPDEIDKYVCAEIPTNNLFEEKSLDDLCTLVRRFQIHHHCKICGFVPNKSKCMSRFPQPIIQNTSLSESFVLLRRRLVEDRMVVPYNPLLLSLWRANMALEYITTSSFIGYVTKYVSKASDHVNIETQIKYKGKDVAENDEIHIWLGSYVIGAAQAAYKLLGYHNFSLNPAVKLLSIHLKDKRNIISIDSSLENIIKKLDNSLSMLQRYFRRPLESDFDELTYRQYYEIYNVIPVKTITNTKDVLYDLGTLNGTNICMIKRRKTLGITRISSYLPSSGEIYYLRLLLLIIPSRNFDDLYEYEQIRYDTYHDVCFKRCLIEKDDEGLECLKEGISLKITPHNLRFLCFLMLSDGSIHFEAITPYYKSLCFDFENEAFKINDITSNSYFINKLIFSLLQLQNENGRTGSFALPDLSMQFMENNKSRNEEEQLIEELSNYYKQNNDLCVNYLTEEQLLVHNQILSNLKEGTGKLLYLQGRAGTGKTLTVRILLKSLFESKILSLPCGTTGIAASQYCCGTTLHKCLSIPIIESEYFISNIGLGTNHAKYLRNIKVIIIDEVSMMTYHLLEICNTILRNLYKNTEPEFHINFGGKNLLLIGDFLQLPPIMLNIYDIDPYSKSLISSEIFSSSLNFALFTSIRYKDEIWRDFIRNIANSSFDQLINWNQILTDAQITDNEEVAIQYLLNDTDSNSPFPIAYQWIAATNMTVDAINLSIQSKRLGKNKQQICQGYNKCCNDNTKKCFNSATNQNITAVDDSYDHVSQEIFNSFKCSSMPNTTIRLQKNDPVFLLRNICPKQGLVKGARGVIQFVSNDGKSCAVKIKNETYIFPRLCFPGTVNDVAFVRHQLPFMLAYAGTVHRCQGMTLNRIVIDLRSDFWEHGQLYVALTRVHGPEEIMVFLPKNRTKVISPVADPRIVKAVLEIESKMKL